VSAQRSFDPSASGYVEVHERVEKFYQRHPEGSIQSFVTARPTSEWPFIEVQTFAYRTPDDPRPGIGNSAEPFPGKTPYTKDSELENAETSAIGRALAALGFETKRSMASLDEIRNRAVAKGKGGGAIAGAAATVQRASSRPPQEISDARSEDEVAASAAPSERPQAPHEFVGPDREGPCQASDCGWAYEHPAHHTKAKQGRLT
jgi:hypothetical protein